MIPLLKPSVSEAEITAVSEVLRSGWWGTGAVVEQFEKEFAAYYGYKYCITVNSATAALHLSMKVLDVHPGDDVIVPAMTFISTGLAPIYVGANVILADIRPDTLCIDWDSVARLMTSKTKVVIPVDYGGYPADAGIKTCGSAQIVQDAAHSCGGITYGSMTCFSFHPVKNLATGDGGAILTNNKAHASRLKSLRWCGIDKSTWERSEKRYGWDYYIGEVGMKCHWNDIQAAIGLVQLHRLNDMNARRRQIAMRYLSELKGLAVLPLDHPKHTWHLFPIRVDCRNRLIDTLLSDEISAGVHYKPLYHYPMFRGDNPVTEQEWRRLVSLPIFPDMTEEEQDKVIRVLKEHL